MSDEPFVDETSDEDSLDEELEMEVDDERLGGRPVERGALVAHDVDRRRYFEELFACRASW